MLAWWLLVACTGGAGSDPRGDSGVGAPDCADVCGRAGGAFVIAVDDRR